MAKKNSQRKDPNDAVLCELEDIKRLLMLLLLKSGTSQSELAVALQKDQSEISRALPARKVKPFEAIK